LTFCIIAADVRSKTVGVVVGGASLDSVLVRGSGVGVVALLGSVDAELSAEMARRIVEGLDPRDALSQPLEANPNRDEQQAFAVDARGRTAAHSGRGCARLFGHTEGTDHVAGGNDLPTPNVIGAMSLSFERSAGDPLWERLMLAMESGARAGGDRGGTRCAMLMVYDEGDASIVDVRVEDHEDVVSELRRLVSEARPSR